MQRLDTIISCSELKRYVHGELSTPDQKIEEVNYSTLKSRMSVSAVIEVEEQNSEEATRISNTLMAMLNSNNADSVKTRYDFFYYPEVQKAKYVVYGSPKTIAEILRVFDLISGQKES
ncbi:MAG: hypothetical protein OCD02_04670 [Spirochaetaceae bacterium]